MHVFAAPFKGAAPNASVLFGVEMRGRDLKLDQTRSCCSRTSPSTRTARSGRQHRLVTMATLRPETKTRIEQTGLRVLNRVDLPPGKYQLRFAAHDSGGGNVGSVLLDLDVPDFLKSPFAISGLALTSAAGTVMPTVRADEQLKAVMPGPAIANADVPAERRDRALRGRSTTTRATRRTRWTSPPRSPRTRAR
jgi:hypothetical protein